MSTQVSIGIVGDWDASRSTHVVTNAALQHASAALSVCADVSWVPTSSLDDERAVRELDRFDGIWAAPGSPYASMDGALAAIRFARESERPFLGT